MATATVTDLVGRGPAPVRRAASQFQVGERVLWLRVTRGRTGYQVIHATVLRISARQVCIAAPLAHGGTVERWVRPTSLMARATE